MQVCVMVAKGRKCIKKEQPTESNPAERSRKMAGLTASVGFRNMEAIGVLCKGCIGVRMGSETG